MDTQLDIFHNTTNLPEPEMIVRAKRAGSQNQIILAFFRRHPNLKLTPFDVQHALGLINTPITSIRRSMTDLTKLGFLIKTTEKRKGEYGAPNYTWKLA